MATANLFDRMGPYAAYMVGQEAELSQRGSHIQNQEGILNLARGTQDFNQKNLTNPVALKQAEANLGITQQEGRRSTFDNNVRDKVGEDAVAGSQKLKYTAEHVKHLESFGPWAGQMAAALENVPPAMRSMLTKKMGDQSGFGDLLQGIENATGETLPQQLRSHAEKAATISQDFLKQSAQIKSSEGIATARNAQAQRGLNSNEKIAFAQINTKENLSREERAAERENLHLKNFQTVQQILLQGDQQKAADEIKLLIAQANKQKARDRDPYTDYFVSSMAIMSEKGIDPVSAAQSISAAWQNSVIYKAAAMKHTINAQGNIGLVNTQPPIPTDNGVRPNSPSTVPGTQAPVVNFPGLGAVSRDEYIAEAQRRGWSPEKITARVTKFYGQ